MTSDQLEANKQVLRQFLGALSSERYDEAFALQASDSPVHLPSPRQTLRAADWHEVYRRLMDTMFPGSGVQYEIGPMTAEEDRVSALAECHGRMKNGDDYNNVYQWLAVVRNGRIVELFESLDTLYADRSIHAAGWVGRRETAES
jgi:ketosteroid isomerase-like protein